MTSKVLITGQLGFTGDHLRRALAARGLETFSDEEIGELDIRSSESVSEVLDALKPDYIIHLAAISFVAHDDASDFYKVNTVGTIGLLEQVYRLLPNILKVVIASSANIYGNTELSPINESFPVRPANHYAASKVAMEALAAQWFDRLPILITRPFNYTGLGQSDRFLVAKVVEHFRRRIRVLELGNLEVTRDFSDVRDVAEIYASLLSSNLTSAAVNICSGTGWSLREIIDECSRQTGFIPQIRVNPAFVRYDEIRTLIGSRETLDRVLPNLTRRDMRETLAWMLE